MVNCVYFSTVNFYNVMPIFFDLLPIGVILYYHKRNFTIKKSPEDSMTQHRMTEHEYISNGPTNESHTKSNTTIDAHIIKVDSDTRSSG